MVAARQGRVVTSDAGQEEGLPRFLTVKEVSDMLRLTTATTRGLLIEGNLVGFQVGDRRMWRVERSDLEAYVAKQKARAAQLGSPAPGSDDH